MWTPVNRSPGSAHAVERDLARRSARTPPSRSVVHAPSGSLRERRQRDRRRRDGVRDDLHDRARVRIRRRRSTWRRTAGRRRRRPTRSRRCGTGRRRRRRAGCRRSPSSRPRSPRSMRAVLERCGAACARMPSASPSMPTLFATKSIVPPLVGSVIGRRDRLADELVLLEDLHAHAEHPVERAVAAVGDPVAGALAEEVAEHRLDRLDRRGLVDLAESPTIRWSRSARSGRLRFLRLFGLVMTPISIGPADAARVGRDAARRKSSRIT